MTSENTAAQRRESRPEGRRATHTTRIAAAEPGSKRREWLILAWLAAEVAAGGDVDLALALARDMNREAALRRLASVDQTDQAAA